MMCFMALAMHTACGGSFLEGTHVSWCSHGQGFNTVDRKDFFKQACQSKEAGQPVHKR